MKYVCRLITLCAELTSCAPAIVAYPASIERSDHIPARFVLLEPVTGISTAGFERMLPAGTVFAEIGSIPAGIVLRPLNKILTVEGANIAEADAVVTGKQWVGFYLRVEHAFSPLQEPVPIKLESQP